MILESSGSFGENVGRIVCSTLAKKKKAVLLSLHFTPQSDVGPPASNLKGGSGAVLSQRTTALEIPAVLQTLKSNSARERSCSVSAGFGGNTGVWLRAGCGLAEDDWEHFLNVKRDGTNFFKRSLAPSSSYVLFSVFHP